MKNNTLAYKILVVAFSLISLGACKTDTASQDEVQEETVLQEKEKPENVAEILNYLRQGEKYAWDTLEATENSKYANIDRLIQEISYNTSHNPNDIKKAKTMSDNLKALFLNRKDIADVSKIKNDILNDSLLANIFEIGEQTPNMETHSLFGQLRTEILKQNNDLVVNLRSLHSTAANNLNDFIDVNIEEIKKQGLDESKVSLWTSGELDE